MQLIEMLKRIGVPEETINTYIEKELIKKDNDNYYFSNGDLLINILTRCIASRIEPKAFLMPETIIDFDDELLVLYTNLITKNYRMASEAAQLIVKKLKTQPLDLLINTLNQYEDNNEYILNNKDYGADEATKEGLKKLERKLLLELELFDLIRCNKYSIQLNMDVVLFHRQLNLLLYIYHHNLLVTLIHNQMVLRIIHHLNNLRFHLNN